MTLKFAMKHPETFLAMRNMKERIDNHMTRVRMHGNTMAWAECTCGWNKQEHIPPKTRSNVDTRSAIFHKAGLLADQHYARVKV